MISIKEVTVSNYISKSKLPSADFVINPYVGCIHKCIYCYAEFMKRFTNHSEEWGEFIDVKLSDKPLNIKNIPICATVLFGSVTDAYNPLERKYAITRKILDQIKDAKFNIEILTKSSLVLRDLDILKQIKNISVGISINSLDDNFRYKTEPRASSVNERIRTLEELHKAGIKTYLFMSPIFPEITDFKTIIQETKNYVDTFCFENLNLRGAYLPRVMNFINENYSEFYQTFDKIYDKKDISYWDNKQSEIEKYCQQNNLDYKIYFFHDKIKKGGEDYCNNNISTKNEK